MNNPLLVGVDPHRKKNVTQMMDRQGQTVGKAVRTDNNRPGTKALVIELVKALENGGFDGVQIATEATGWYWLPFLQALNEDDDLAQWPVDLYALNPRLTAKFKQTYSDRDKADHLDAFVIADRLRMGRDLPQPFQGDDSYFPLRLLTRHRRHVVLGLVREKSYFLALLYLKASEYTHSDKQPFSTVFGATSRAVIQEFSSMEEIAALPLEDLAEFIDAKGKRRFADPAHNAQLLHQVATDSYQLPQPWLQSVNMVLRLSLQHITALERQMKRLDTAISDLMASIPHTLDTIPGFGPVYSAGIIAEIAGVERFDFDHAKVAKYAGLRWRHSGSADFQAEDTPLSRSGNAHLRYYLCEAANIVRMHDADYRAYYQRKHSEVPKHRHKRAIVLTARKLVRLVVRLLTTNQPYRPRRP